MINDPYFRADAYYQVVAVAATQSAVMVGKVLDSGRADWDWYNATPENLSDTIENGRLRQRAQIRMEMATATLPREPSPIAETDR